MIRKPASGADPAFALRLALVVLRQRRRAGGQLLLGHRRELLVGDEIAALQAAEDDAIRNVTPIHGLD